MKYFFLISFIVITFGAILISCVPANHTCTHKQNNKVAISVNDFPGLIPSEYDDHCIKPEYTLVNFGTNYFMGWIFKDPDTGIRFVLHYKGGVTPLNNQTIEVKTGY